MHTKLTLGERLKDLRIERGCTLEELAAQTGLSKAALGKYETNESGEVSLFAVTKLAGFYGVTTDYLLGLVENKNRPDAALADLHLSDKAIEMLKSGKVNNRLFCELVTHSEFPRLMADMEIYVDGMVSMQIQNLNALLESVERGQHPADLKGGTDQRGRILCPCCGQRCGEHPARPQTAAFRGQKQHTGRIFPGWIQRV